jgi:hypothetical protein
MNRSTIRVDRQDIWVAVKPGAKVWRTRGSDAARTFFARQQAAPLPWQGPGEPMFSKSHPEVPLRQLGALSTCRSLDV